MGRCGVSPLERVAAHASSSEGKTFPAKDHQSKSAEVHTTERVLTSASCKLQNMNGCASLR